MLMELKVTNDQLELSQGKFIIKRKEFGGKSHFGFTKETK